MDNKETYSEMQQSELVMSLVLLNEQTFKNLSKEDVKKIVMTTKIVKENKNIERQYNTYKAIDLYNKLHKVVIGYVFGKQTDETINELISHVYKSNEEIQKNFFNLMISEYKEYVYNSIYDPYFEDTEIKIMDKYECIIKSDEQIQERLCKHVHEASDEIYERAYYMFHEMVEKYGYSILDENREYWDIEYE